MNKWRRFEVMLPLQFNDGAPVSWELIGEATEEVADYFDAATLETQTIEGRWRHEGNLYRDNLVRIVVDVPDSAKNRTWMKKFKARWKARLEQLEIWMVSYRIEVE